MTHKGEDISGQVGTGMGTVWRGQALTLSLTGGGGLGGPPLAELTIAPKRIYISI